jgi:hypothetical protein
MSFDLRYANTTGMKAAPITLLIPPSSIKSSGKLTDFYNKLPSKYKYQLTKIDSTAADVIEFLGKHITAYSQATSDSLSNADPASKPSISQLLIQLFHSLADRFDKTAHTLTPIFQLITKSKSLALNLSYMVVTFVPLMLLGYFVKILYYPSSTLSSEEKTYNAIIRRFLAHHYTPLAIISIILYGLATSGYMHNIIRENPNHGHIVDGKPTYFSQEFMGQFVYEGYIVGTINISLACVVLLSTIRAFAVYTIHNDEGHGHVDDGKGTSRSTSSKRQETWSRIDYMISWIISPLIMLFIAGFLWRTLVAIFTYKNGGYNHNWLWYYRSAEDVYRPVVRRINPYTKQIWGVLAPVLPFYNHIWKALRRRLPSYVFAWL